MVQGATELLAILRAFVQEKSLTLLEVEQMEQNLPEVIQLAKIHGVLGIWAYKIREYYHIHSVSSPEDQELSDTAEQVFSRTVQNAVKRELLYQGLSRALSEAGVDHLPFKGIVVKEFYPVPELRTYGDVDMVIRTEDRDRCHALMQELGYRSPVDFEPVYTYRKDGELYEIHTGIMSVNFTDRADYIGYFRNLWNNASLPENHVWAFSPEFHFVYLLSHIAKHIYGSGAGIRMYLDLAFYIKCLGSTMDWNMVQSGLRKIGLEQFFHLTLQNLHWWFGISLPIPVQKVEKSILEAFFDFTMEAGTFGYEGRNSGEQLVRQQGRKDETGLRIKALCSTYFPPAKKIQCRYTYLQKHSWLLPVAWIDRFFRNLRHIGTILEDTGDIIGTKQDEIQKVNSFYHDIGL